jgi:hypothetical protein
MPGKKLVKTMRVKPNERLSNASSNQIFLKVSVITFAAYMILTLTSPEISLISAVFYNLTEKT